MLYNTFIDGGPGGGCSSNSVTVRGNIMKIGACASGYAFSFNVFLSGSVTCGSNLRQCSVGFSSGSSPTDRFHLLLADSCARNAGDPSSYPSTDHDGGPRPQGPGVDAGADEIG